MIQPGTVKNIRGMNTCDMDIITAIRTRRSIRKFKREPVSMDLLNNVIEMATWAPSATNRQGWRFIIIDDPQIKQKIINNGGAVIINNSPCGILVVYDERTRNLQYQDFFQSGAAAIQNLLLAAHNYGLGSCWVCHLPTRAALRRILKIPKGFSPIAYILIGYKEKEPTEMPRKYPLDSLIGHNTFNYQGILEKGNTFKTFLVNILVKVYHLTPISIKRGFLNKFIDQKFVKKFDN
jgi:nitroreductase